MQGPTPNPAAPITTSGTRRASRVMGFIIGAALLAAAIWAAWSQRTTVIDALRLSLSSRWWLVALALLLPILNWLISTIVFFFLMKPANDRAPRPAPFSEMLCLIGSAWLFNYLPLSPGLFGRVFYQRTFHGIPVLESFKAIIAGILLSIVLIALLLLTTLLFSPVADRPAAYLTGLILISPALFLLAHLLRSRGPQMWSMLIAAATRWLDLLVWVARYYVVFRILNQDISLPQATIFAAASQAAMQVPLIGNGLGIREWTIGLVAPHLPASALTRSLALSADLINRACELVVAIPVGLACTAILARRSHSVRT